MIRSKFDSELEKLNSDLILMGAMCEEAISGVIRALETDDKALAKKLVSEDDKIDMKEREIENECLKLMLQQQPVAKDLRLISSAIKMITDMERIGDQAADIAEIVFFANLSAHISRPRLIDMSQATAKMVTESIDAFVRRDLELARKVRGDDDIVDALFRDVRGDVIASITNKTGKGEEAVDIIMIAKYFERIGDHATNIAEWVEFAITGNHPVWSDL
jgi:phosphate transport system protein